MVNSGKPSKACALCRTRKIKVSGCASALIFANVIWVAVWSASTCMLSMYQSWSQMLWVQGSIWSHIPRSKPSSGAKGSRQSNILCYPIEREWRQRRSNHRSSYRIRNSPRIPYAASPSFHIGSTRRTCSSCIFPLLYHGRYEFKPRSHILCTPDKLDGRRQRPISCGLIDQLCTTV